MAEFDGAGRARRGRGEGAGGRAARAARALAQAAELAATVVGACFMCTAPLWALVLGGLLLRCAWGL